MWTILREREFARLSVYLGWDPKETALVLSDPCEYGMNHPAAKALVAEAIAERQQWEAAERRALDESARSSEHDLAERLAGASADVGREYVYRASEVALLLHKSGICGSEDELLAFVHGAFMLPLDVSWLVVLLVTDPDHDAVPEAG